jgi:hypothetical protein
MGVYVAVLAKFTPNEPSGLFETTWQPELSLSLCGICHCLRKMRFADTAEVISARRELSAFVSP